MYNIICYIVEKSKSYSSQEKYEIWKKHKYFH